MDELNTKIDIIPKDAIVSIDVSGFFYKRLQDCLFATLNEQDNVSLPIILKELEERAPKTLWEEHVMNYLALTLAVDEAAAKQGLIIKQDLSEHIPKQDPSEEASPES